jgi:L-threonylcarbamoyladenylate synthase
MARSIVAEWPERAQLLAQRFWPGPLTLVLPKRSVVPGLVTAGLHTVGVRMPAHPVALALIKAAQVPVAAPSANRFSQISPTTAQHVRDGLGNRVDYILDGGPCTVGIESTVLSLAGTGLNRPQSLGAPSLSASLADTVEPTTQPVLLRPGGVSRAQLEAVIGPIEQQREAGGEAHPSPGMHPRHYSPRTRLVLVTDGNVPPDGAGAYLQLRHEPGRQVREVVQMPRDVTGYAAQLYSTLHRLDVCGYDWIAVDAPPNTLEWEAVRDRLRRAAG